jgi:hypothetical protein
MEQIIIWLRIFSFTMNQYRSFAQNNAIINHGAPSTNHSAKDGVCSNGTPGKELYKNLSIEHKNSPGINMVFIFFHKKGLKPILKVVHKPVNIKKVCIK